MQNFFWLFVEMVLPCVWAHSRHLRDVITSLTNPLILLISMMLTLALAAEEDSTDVTSTFL